MRRWIFEAYDDVCWWTKHYARYIRERHVRPWRIWSRHRKHFFETTDWMLASQGFPFLKRIWFRYIFWLLYFANGYLNLYRDDLKRITTKAYCRCADALLGGNRSEQFLAVWKARVADLKEQNRDRAESRLKQDEELFELRVGHEARQNPNFVATSHTHQDRH